MNILLGNLRIEDIVHDKYIKKIQKFLDENGYKKVAGVFR